MKANNLKKFMSLVNKTDIKKTINKRFEFLNYRNKMLYAMDGTFCVILNIDLGPDKFFVHYKLLNDILKTLSANSDIVIEKDRFVIDKKNFINYSQPEGIDKINPYFVVKGNVQHHRFMVSTKDLKKALKFTMKDFTREYVDKVCYVGNTIIATDAHRATIIPTSEQLSGLEQKFPARFINMLPSEPIVWIDSSTGEDDYELSCTHENITVKVINTQFKYPNVKGVFPIIENAKDEEDFRKRYPHRFKFSVNKRVLEQALKNALIIADDEKKVSFEIHSNKLVLSSRNEDVDCKQTVTDGYRKIQLHSLPVEEGFKISFNIQYLLDIISILDDISVSFVICTNNYAAIINEHYLLMPLMPTKN